MSVRWYIYKDGQVLGPLPPEEIRDGLRDGTFEPFDLVSREGSNVKLELVEVDEIFQTDTADYDRGEGHLGGDETAVGLQMRAPTEANKRPRWRVVATSGSPQTYHPRYYAYQKKGKGRQQRSRKGLKRFYLINKSGRVAGPVSADEILSLYYKGLDRQVKVLKDGSKSQVPVWRFVSVYTDLKSKQGRQQGAHAPNQRVRTPTRGKGLVAVDHLLIWLAALLMACGLGAAGIVAWDYIEHHGANWLMNAPWNNPDKKKVKKRTERTLKPSPKGNTKLERKLERQNQLEKRRRHQESLKARKATARTTKLRPQGSRNSSDMARSTVGKSPQTRPRLVPGLSRYRHNVTRPPRILSVPSKPQRKVHEKSTSAFRPSVRPGSPRPPPRPKPPPKKPTPRRPQVASLADGQIVSRLGPMTYDPFEVGRCSGPCSVAFWGAGGRVTVKFFKDAWAPILEKKGGKAYISGRVRREGSGVVIVLQDVK